MTDDTYDYILKKVEEAAVDEYKHEAQRIIEQQESMLRGHEENIDKLEDENESLRQDLQVQTRIQQEYKRERDMFKDELSKFIEFVLGRISPHSVIEAAEELKRWLEARER